MSRVKVVLITRFGIGIKESKWYDYRYIVHKTFGQSCILNQTNQNFEWLICLDSNPPNDFYLQLKQDFKNKTNVHLLRIESNFVKEYREFIENNILDIETEKIVFVRHDDDDALHVDYIKTIHEQIENKNELLHFIEESDKTMSRIQQLRNNSHWGRLIQEHFKSSLNDFIFFGKNSENDVKVYYKNKYMTTVGRIAKFGSVQSQLENLEQKIEKESQSDFIPFASIHSYKKGYVYNKDGNHNLYEINLECNAQALFSILPTRNQKISNFRDCMYEAGESHMNLHRLKGIAYYCHNDQSENYIIVRSFINDSYGGGNYNKYIPNFNPLVFSKRIQNIFSIENEKYQIFLRTVTFCAYEKKTVHAIPTIKQNDKVTEKKGEIDLTKLKEEKTLFPNRK
jgi:hypothetical protein